MAKQYKILGQTTDSEGNSHDILEAQFAPTRKGARFRKWFVCPICGRTYENGQGTLVKGIRYCTVEPCADDARSGR